MKFRSGNIIKSPYGSIVIFLKYRKSIDRDVFDWISFDHSNSSGTSPVKTESMVVDCNCHYDNWVDDESTAPRVDCDVCKGTGDRISISYGEDKYMLLADSAKDYLSKLLNGALIKL